MPALLGKRCIVDDPGFERAAMRYRRHHSFTHFRQHQLVGTAETRAGAITAAGSRLCRPSVASNPEQ
jgi:hypothetical protein